MRLVGWAALSAAVAVAAGAFGAHGAHGPAVEWLRTGGQYQLVHAVAAAALAGRLRAVWPPVLLLAGSALFAATLYGLALGGPRWLGAVAPVGGLGMIGGWIGVAIAAFRAPPTRPEPVP